MAHQRGGLQCEYAVSGRSSCKSCGSAISEDSLRIGKETRSDFHDGWDLTWHHLKCCNHGGGPYITKIADVREWEHLRWDDQLKIMKLTGEKVADTDEEKRREKENRELWDLKDQLADKVNRKILKSLLEANFSDLGKATPQRILHKVADGMLWGVISPCPECKGENTLRYNGKEYICKTGWISEFTRCEWKGTEGVSRYKFVIPAEFKKSNDFLKNWKYPEGHPTGVKGAEGSDGKKEEEKAEEVEEDDDGSEEEEPPVGKELWGIVVTVAGSAKELGMKDTEIAEIVENHGGTFEKDHKIATVMITTEKKKKTAAMNWAIKNGIPLLTVDWLTNLAERKEEGIKLRKAKFAKEYAIGTLEEDKKLGKKYSKAAEEKEKAKAEIAAKKEEEQKKKEEEEKKKDEDLLKKRKRREPVSGSDILKVDPQAIPEVSGTPEILVTYDDTYGYTPYSVMLNVSDISTGANKFYRMQVIKTAGKKTWYFWISWGRVGTDIGDHRIYKKGSESSAIEQFAEKFFDQTGNTWEERFKFQKKPGKYFMVELDDGNEDEDVEQEIKKVKREKAPKKDDKMEVDAKVGGETISKRVQDLVNTIFDKEMMKKTLQSMDVDIKKMPLGKISKKQIQEGYKVLTEVQEVLQQKDPPKSKIQDATNRFYTLIPHDFGRNSPPLIDNLEAVRKKIDLMDTLLDIEIANAVMKDADKLDESDPVYKNYKSLKADIQPVEKDSDLYKLLESYAYNTHDKKYFSTFDFEVLDVFQIQREGENDRYKQWKDFENRVLLWHGSRLTNWVGIISQGLRIAPPEAPKTGYRFGKGIYFADVISKSGSYCFTSNDSPYAVMLLAEVALGKMNELLKDEYMEKAPKGTHCTKALGMAAPDPKSAQEIPINVTVPCGKVKETGIRSACSHNEYIVYDTTQVSIRYLIKLKFKHKSAW